MPNWLFFRISMPLLISSFLSSIVSFISLMYLFEFSLILVIYSCPLWIQSLICLFFKFIDCFYCYFLNSMTDIHSSSQLFRCLMVALAFEGGLLPCCIMLLHWDLYIWRYFNWRLWSLVFFQLGISAKLFKIVQWVCSGVFLSIDWR